MRIPVEDFRKLSNSVLVKHGLTKKEANLVTDEILDAEMRGREGHGASLLPKQAKRIAERKGRMSIVRENECSALIDGKDNIGPVVSRFCMDLAMRKAKKCGIGIVGTYNKFVFVLAGYHVRRAAENHLIGIITSAAAARVAPWGGIDPILGTNPIAVGIPSKGRPIVLDMTTSVRAAAEIREAKKSGEEIPEGWAIDKNGKPTTNPEEALNGALLPFDTYKGYGLGLVVEVLGGLLVNAKAGNVVKGKRGMLFIAIDPNIFVDTNTFEKNVGLLIEEIKSSRKAENVNEILIPGERSSRRFEKAITEGIEISQSVLEEIQRLQ